MAENYVIYTEERLVDGKIDRHIVSGVPGEASWSKAEAEGELAAILKQNSNLRGFAMQIEGLAL
jgi:hypothetical protein